MILLTDRESYNLLAVKLDTVLAIWLSQLGKETPSLKWIPTHLERDREGGEVGTEGGGERKGRNRGTEGGKERERVNNNNITHHIKQNIQDWVSIYQQNFYNAHTIPFLI